VTSASKLARVLLFIALVVAVSGLLASGVVEASALVPLRRAIAAGAAAVLGGAGLEARGEGVFVHLAAGSVEIVDSCTGLDVWLILASAMLAFPASWRARAVGIALAGGVVLGANFLRVLVLCTLVGSEPALFDVVHGYAWPVLMIAACLAVSLYWMQSIALVGEGGGHA
jgi:exosortase/archaeosortase family protein